MRHVCRWLAGMILLLPAPLLGSDGVKPSRDDEARMRVRAEEQARIELIEQVAPAVACLFNRGNRAGGGSGVLIDPAGYGLTNFHVVAGMLKNRQGVAGMPDGTLYDMEILGFDPGGDVAMFRLLGRKAFPFVRLGDSDTLEVGQDTLAMGNPFLLAEDYTPTVTLGIISGLHRYQSGAGEGGLALRYTDCIQVATSINPGNSGGPLFNLAGDLVGINGRVSVEERGRVNVGVGYAITINQIKRFIPMLRAGMVAQHATAGFTVIDRASEVVVDQILEDSLAYQAGLRLGDPILRFADKQIRSANHLASLLGTFPARWPTTLVFQHQGHPRKVSFRLEDLPLPKRRGRHGKPHRGKGLDAPHPMARQANRHAVERALNLYQQAMGNADIVARLEGIQMMIRRTFNSPPGRRPVMLEVTESRAAESKRQDDQIPGSLEQAIRWSLLRPIGAIEMQDYRVVGADEVNHRIAVVIEHRSASHGPAARDDSHVMAPAKSPGDDDHQARSNKKNEWAYRLALNDENGQLLRLEFDDPQSGKPIRYEYDEYHPDSELNLPHVRRLFLNNELYAADHIEKIDITLR